MVTAEQDARNPLPAPTIARFGGICSFFLVQVFVRPWPHLSSFGGAASGRHPQVRHASALQKEGLSGVAGGLVAGVIGQLIADHRDLVVASSGKTELSRWLLLSSFWLCVLPRQNLLCVSSVKVLLFDMARNE
jgi:hypothetical protein